DDDVNVLFEEAVAGGSFVEIERLAPAQNGYARHVNFHAIGIEFYAGATRGGEDAAPVWIAAREGGFDQGRGRNRLPDAASRRFGFRATDFEFDHALRAFAIGHDL